MVKASPRIAPTVMRGLSEANGSWNTICMLRRMARRSPPERPSMSLSVKDDLAFAGFDEAQHAARRGGLAATGLADQSERFAAVDRKRHAVDRVNAPDLARQQAALDGKMLLQPGDAQQGFAHALAPCVSPRWQAMRWPGADLAQHRFLFGAEREGEAAARREAAAGRGIDQDRHGAADRFQPGLVRAVEVDARDRADQPCV